MFQVAQFVADCKRANAEANAQGAVREVVARAVSGPGEILRALGEPELAGVHALYRAGDLTVIHFVWGPDMWLPPHDHGMWAVIGIYGGREHNVFYGRSENGLIQRGSKDLDAKATIPLAKPAIHAVHNPLAKLTAALHVYGGDFYDTPRREWDPETFEEKPYDLEKNLGLFEKANEKLRAAAGEVLEGSDLAVGKNNRP
jgi:predicted metal-dependent enzyme (double-stranded beta helix superfamily)